MTPGYGENIYWTSEANPNFTSSTQNAIVAWMSEESQYTDPNNPNGLHYTQVQLNSLLSHFEIREN
jgi:hypothetical protein